MLIEVVSVVFWIVSLLTVLKTFTKATCWRLQVEHKYSAVTDAVPVASCGTGTGAAEASITDQRLGNRSHAETTLTGAELEAMRGVMPASAELEEQQQQPGTPSHAAAQAFPPSAAAAAPSQAVLPQSQRFEGPSRGHKAAPEGLFAQALKECVADLAAGGAPTIGRLSRRTEPFQSVSRQVKVTIMAGYEAAGVVLGCSRCRYAPTGCSSCRTKADAKVAAAQAYHEQAALVASTAGRSNGPDSSRRQQEAKAASFEPPSASTAAIPAAISPQTQAQPPSGPHSVTDLPEVLQQLVVEPADWWAALAAAPKPAAHRDARASRCLYKNCSFT